MDSARLHRDLPVESLVQRSPDFRLPLPRHSPAICWRVSFFLSSSDGKVLVVSWGLTLFVSTLYGDVFGEWDRSSVRVGAGSLTDNGSGDGEAPSMAGGRGQQ